MKKIINSLLITLFVLLVSTSMAFANAPTTNPTASATYNAQTHTLTLNSDVKLTSDWQINGTTGDLNGSQSFNITNWTVDGYITTLDLNGNSISNDNYGDYSIIVGTGTSNNTLTVINSKEDGEINFTGNTGSKGNTAFEVNNGSSLILDGVTITGSNSVDSNTGIISIKTGGSVTMKNDALLDVGEYVYGVYVGDKGTSGTSTLNVNASTITADADNTVAIGTSAQSGNDANYVINITNGSKVTRELPATEGGSSYEPAIFSSNPNTELTISDSEVTGPTGIFVRGGTIDISNSTITGTAPASQFQAPLASGTTSTGNAIVSVNSSSTNYANYGKANITITGSEITSENTYAIAQYGPGSTIDNPNNSSYSTLESLTIIDSELSGKGGSDSNDALPQTPFVDQDNNDLTGYIGDQTSITGTLPKGALADNILASVTVDGTTKYFANIQDAQEYAEDNDTEPDYIVPEITPDSSIYQFASLSINNTSLLNFITITNEGMTLTQSQDVYLTIIPFNAANNTMLTPEQLTWSVESIPGGTVPSFTNDWTVDGDPVVSSDGLSTSVQKVSYSTDGNWWLEYTYTVTNVENTDGISEPVVSFSDVTLNYKGQDTVAGVYQLNAETDPAYENAQYVGALEASVRFVVTEKTLPTINEVVITRDGEEVDQFTNVDLSETRYVQFGYLATTKDGEEVEASTVTWDATLTNSKLEDSDYYSLNTNTGAITFYQALPTNTYIALTVTVNDSLKATVLVSTSGAITPVEMVGIDSAYDPVYVTTNTNYNLITSLVVTPTNEPLYGMAGTMSYESSNSQVYIYEGSNKQWYAVAPSSNFTGSTVITATYTDEDGQSYPTEFTLKFVGSKSIPAAGIMAEDELNFNLENPVAQNVNAQITPEENTAQYEKFNIEYESADTSIAIVDKYGNVTPISEGKTTVTSTLDGWSVTTTIYVDETPEPEPTGELTIDPEYVYLSSVEGNTTSQTVDLIVPEELEGQAITWNSSANTVAIVEGEGTSVTVVAVAEGQAEVTATVGDQTATAYVTVSNNELIARGGIEVTSDDPDYFTVTAKNVTANPAIPDNDTVARKVVIFAYSDLKDPNNDINKKDLVQVEGTNDWVYRNMPVNNTDINNYFLNADDIQIDIYATDTNVQGINGPMIATTTYKWFNDQNNVDDNTVAYIGYIQNEGFQKPTKYNMETAGTTGQSIQMEGLRVSSGIDGVEVLTNVHIQNIGWLNEAQGRYAYDGEYAGTMGKNLQIEAVQLQLVGENADQYTIQYRVHVQNEGWMPWTADNAISGTTGRGLQMEAIEIRIVEAGTSLPANN